MLIKTEYILIFIILVLIIKIYTDSDIHNLVCKVSEIDKNTYCVLPKKNSKKVVDLFAKLSLKINKLISYLKKNYNNNKAVNRLITKYNPKKIVEVLPDSKFTAYSENKGEKIALCSTTKRKGGDIIDENTLMFVTLHELAHIMTVSIGHTEEFWRNFKQLLIYASEIKIYTPEDYSKKSKKYCGLSITESPYYL